MARDTISFDPRFLFGTGALAALGAVVLSSVSFSPPGLPGIWFSETRRGDAVRQTLLHFAPDGGFRTVGRELRDCRVVARSGAAGRWDMTPQKVTLRVAEVNGEARSAEEVFDLAWLSENRLRLVAADGEEIGGLRTPAGFDFPPPAGCPEEGTPPPLRG
jgi:hypothetical protein